VPSAAATAGFHANEHASDERVAVGSQECRLSSL
jgi:hypothetical protein